MGKLEGKIATNWPSEREKIKKGLKIDIEWLCPDAFNSGIYTSLTINCHILTVQKSNNARTRKL